MPLAYLTLITGLAISVVAIYYSVIGLAAIFSAAVVAIIVMGAILEVAKLVAAWWLKANWDRAPFLLKSYMLVAVVVLMLITSMGIFGFLSKAHTDQAIVTGDVQAQVYLIDEQVKVERENITNAQSLIKQLDDAVVGINASGVDREFKLRDGTTRVQSAAERALQVRLSQASDRSRLTSQIESSQTKILALQQKKAPIAAEMREVEAKVGPIKYIAQLIYGNNPDENLLEKAVTWVIITIVFVFDPLAVLLLLASQMSFQWAREDKEGRKYELVEENTGEDIPKKEAPSPSGDGPSGNEQGGSADTDRRQHDQAESASARDSHGQDEKKLGDSREKDRLLAKGIDTEEQSIQADEANLKIAQIPTDQLEFVALPKETETDQEKTSSDTEDIYDNRGYDISAAEDEEELEKERSSRSKMAMQAWKAENPSDSLKHQRLLFEQGLIDHLPWKEFLQEEEDYLDNEAAVEAAKWAREQVEESKKKVTWIEKQGNRQIKKTKEI